MMAIIHAWSNSAGVVKMPDEECKFLKEKDKYGLMD